MNGIRFTHLDHCSVIITDIARSRDFYSRVLGLQEIAKPKTFDFVALWYQMSDGQTLHLLQKSEPDTRSPRHFALRVTDVQAAREYFRSQNVEMQETGPIPFCDRVFIHDPDGNRIEVIQWHVPYNPVESGATQLDR